jgi:hypothetical protein
MPRFYLHLYNRIGAVPDEEGEDLPDLSEARESAFEAIRDIVSEEARHGTIDLRGRIEIAGEGSNLLAVVPFSEAVEVHLERDKQ